jgi:hypothetical protein
VSFTLAIPTWLCWLIGVPVGLFLLFALIIGLCFIISPPVLFK